MAHVEGFIALIIGAAVLLYDYRSWNHGVIRIGRAPRGDSRLDGEYIVQRATRPVLFMIAVVIYAVIGCGLIVFSILVVTGISEPLSAGFSSLNSNL